jgi:integrase
VAVAIAYTFGWRIRSEVLSLTLAQVDLAAGTLRLEPGHTKNDDGRLVNLTPELTALLRAQVERVMTLMRKRGAVIPYLFPHLDGRFVRRRSRLWVHVRRGVALEERCAGTGVVRVLHWQAPPGFHPHLVDGL